MNVLVALVALVVCASTVHADTLFVKAAAPDALDGQSWQSATTLRDALSKASSGDEVWMAEGFYPTGDQRTMPPSWAGATFEIPAGVRIYGGFEGTESMRQHRDWLRRRTVLTGDVLQNDGQALALDDPLRAENSHTVIKLTGNHDSTTIIDGLVVMGGNNTIGPGGGMFVEAGCPLISNCRFESNAAERGGALYAARPSRMRIEYSQFVRNRALYGGAVVLDSSDHTGWGAWIVNSVFQRNEAAFDAGALHVCQPNGSTVQLASCVFTHNVAGGKGGAVVTDDSTTVMVYNGTFNENAIFNEAGTGAALVGSTTTILNSIFWTTSEADVKQIADVGATDDTLKATCTACLVRGDFDLGFWNGDPWFELPEKPEGNDGIWFTPDDGLRLAASSPVRDGGVLDRFINMRQMDILGNCRLVDRKIDIGAYESQREGHDAYDALFDSLRAGGYVLMFRHMATDWGQRDPGPSPECFPGRNLIHEGRVQSREVGWAMTALGITLGDVFSSPVCRCWESAELIAGRHEKRQHWASGGNASANRKRDLGTPTAAGTNRLIITHDAVILPLTSFTSAEIMEGDAVLVRPDGDTNYTVIGHFTSENFIRQWVRSRPIPTSVVQEYGKGASLTIVPNPVVESMEIHGVAVGDVLDVMNLQGVRVATAIATAVPWTISTAGIPPGVYILRERASSKSSLLTITR